MYSLTLDTSNSHCSVAIYKNNDLVVSKYIDIPNMQAKSLALVVEMLILQMQIKYTDLKNIIITSGPGSFTGVRIGLAYAKGCKIALPNVKVYNLSTLEAIGYSYFYTQKAGIDMTKVAVIQNAWRGQVYLQIFSASSALNSDMQLFEYSQAENYLKNFYECGKLILLGSGRKFITSITGQLSDNIYVEEKYSQDNLPNAYMAFEAFLYMQQNKLHMQQNISPTYLRPAL